MRAGLAAVLSSDETIEVVGEAGRARGRLPSARAAPGHRSHGRADARPGRHLGNARGARGLAGREGVILTTFEEDEYIFGALSAGASGFLLKRTSPRS